MRSYKQSNLAFCKMALKFLVRDWFTPPRAVLLEAGLAPGLKVLDFGCGPGGFSLAAAQIVGRQGTVWALDIHPLAVKFVERASEKRSIKNIITLLGENTIAQVNDETIDMVLLYDVLHILKKVTPILADLHRVLKPGANLSVSDHHMQEDDIKSELSRSNLFNFNVRTGSTLQFQRVNSKEEIR